MSGTQTTGLEQGAMLFDDVARRALGRYGFEGDEAKLLTFSENYTYLVRNPVTGSKDAVLRISRPGYHTLKELEGEMAWLRQINDYTPLVVANPLPARDGSYIQSVTGPDGASYQCVVCEFLSGEAPSEGDPKGMVSQFCQLGETTAYLHRQTEIWNGTRRLKRISWTYDTIIGEHAAWGPWQAFEGLAPQDTTQLERCCTTIQRRLERYGMSERTFGLIHADLRLANLLVENDQVKVIDFDDCGFGWHLHDLAGALSFIETSPLACDLVNSWLDGYRKVLPFTDTDFEEIDTFIMQRRLQLTAWLASHKGSDPVKELSVGWVDGTMELAERYLRLFA